MYSQISIYQSIVTLSNSILLDRICFFFCKSLRNYLTLFLKTIMGKVRFYLERPVPGTAANITLYFSYKRDLLKMAIGEKILPEHWDDKSQRPLRRLLSNTKLQYRSLSNLLDDLEEQTLSILTNHRRERKLVLLDKKRFRYLLKSYLEGSSSIGGMTFFQYLEQFIQEREKSNYSAPTINQYKATQKHLLTFADKYLGYRFDFDDVGLPLFKSFRDYFWENRRSYSDNTVHKYISHFKSIVAQAYKEEYHNNDKFNIELKIDLKVGRTPADEIALSIDEINQLRSLDLKGKKEKVRDLFITHCFTGLRVSDWWKLTKDKIQYDAHQDAYFEIKVQKTNKELILPLHPIAKEILKKYNYQLPKVAEQTINQTIKEIASQVGFTETETKFRIESNQEVEYQIARFNRIKSHTARRTFATLLRLFKMNPGEARKLTGHSSDRMFAIYDKSSGKEEVLSLRDNAFFSLT